MLAVVIIMLIAGILIGIGIGAYGSADIDNDIND